MRTIEKNLLRRLVSFLLVVVYLPIATGCATLAHRSSVSGERVRSTSNCAGAGEVCPWLLGDAGLLLLGIVPGVIAFIVDFGTGSWQHPAASEIRTASDETASAFLLFDPPRAQVSVVPRPADSERLAGTYGDSLATLRRDVDGHAAPVPGAP